MRVSTVSTGTGRRASGRSAPQSTIACACWRRSIRSCGTAGDSNYSGAGRIASRRTPLAKRKLGYYALPMLWRDRVVGWANLSVRDEVLQHELGYADGPADASFAIGLDAARSRSPLSGLLHRTTRAAPTSAEVLAGAREVAITNPRKVLFPEAGVTKLDLARATTSPSPMARCARPAAGPTSWSAIRTASAASSSTRSARNPGPSGSRWCRCISRPAAPPWKSSRATPPRSSGWPTSRASSCTSPGAGRRSRSPGRAARRPRSRARRRVAADPAGRARRARRARRSRPDRLAEDVGLARIHVSIRIARRWTFDQVRRAALALARDVERRAPGWRRASGGRRSGRASSSTTTRTPRIAPSRAPTRCGRSPARVSAPPDVGRDRHLRSA